MLLVVGLGNPGKEYEKTNHNAGFRVVDEVASKLNVKFEKKPVCDSLVAISGVGENKVILAKPQTYMNNSGLSVVQLVKKYNINCATELLVVADDFDVQEGTIRIRTKSGNSTHNGIRSIKEHLKTNEFMRVKVSIAPKPDYMGVADFVLSKVKNKNVEQSENKAVEAICELISGKAVELVMTKFSS